MTHPCCIYLRPSWDRGYGCFDRVVGLSESITLVFSVGTRPRPLGVSVYCFDLYSLWVRRTYVSVYPRVITPLLSFFPHILLLGV